jgi:ankyrin repeat protein
MVASVLICFRKVFTRSKVYIRAALVSHVNAQRGRVMKMNFDQAHRVIKKGDILAIRQAVQDGLSPNLSNNYSWTLLMLAAFEGNTAITEFLVAQEADIHAVNNFGETALSLAAHKGHVRLTEWLIGKGASTDCRPHGRQLSDWVRETSGLPLERVSRILTLLGERSHLH